ncbi:unnamed protein product, partial [Prorocentrum cordatum]
AGGIRRRLRGPLSEGAALGRRREGLWPRDGALGGGLRGGGRAVEVHRLDLQQAVEQVGAREAGLRRGAALPVRGGRLVPRLGPAVGPRTGEAGDEARGAGCSRPLAGGPAGGRARAGRVVRGRGHRPRPRPVLRARLPRAAGRRRRRPARDRPHRRRGGHPQPRRTSRPAAASSWTRGPASTCLRWCSSAAPAAGI